MPVFVQKLGEAQWSTSRHLAPSPQFLPADAEQLHDPGVCSTHSDIPRLWRGTTNYGEPEMDSSKIFNFHFHYA